MLSSSSTTRMRSPATEPIYLARGASYVLRQCASSVTAILRQFAPTAALTDDDGLQSTSDDPAARLAHRAARGWHRAGHAAGEPGVRARRPLGRLRASGGEHCRNW